MKKYLFLYLFFSFSACVTALMPSNLIAAPSIFQKLVKEQFAEIELETDFDQLQARPRKAKEQTANIRFLSTEGKELKLTIKVGLRGVFRRQICDMPPLKLNFSKTDLENIGINPIFDKLKVVTHCVANAKSDEILLKEFYTYQLYNQISLSSFKVHLVKIIYINTRNNSEKEERMAFLIENNKEMASRVGGTLVEKFGTTASKVDKVSHQNTMLFNYMIGNLDWSLKRQRNIKFIQHPEKKGLMVIPYDFDFCALVRPSYATLNPDFNQQKFEDRFCIGKFTSEKELKSTIDQFTAVKDSLLQAIKENSKLSKSSRKKMSNYLKNFFELLNKEKEVKAIFLSATNSPNYLIQG